MRVKQGCPLSPNNFGIYIDKLEEFLKHVACVGPMLSGIDITHISYIIIPS